MARGTRTTSLVELRTIEAGMRQAAAACAGIPPSVRSDRHIFINSTPVRVSDLRALVEAHRRIAREIRRRRGAETPEDRAAAARDERLRDAAPALLATLVAVIDLAIRTGEWTGGERAVAIADAEAAIAAAGGREP